MLQQNKEVLERLDLGFAVKTNTDSVCQAFPLSLYSDFDSVALTLQILWPLPWKRRNV